MRIQKYVGKWKQILTILILAIVCMLNGRMPGGKVQAATYGDYEYKMNEDGDTVTITNYTGSGTVIKIPETIYGMNVTEIGSYSFKGCSSLISIVIPEGVRSIGYSAFDECSSLTSIAIPESVTYIASNPFSGCSGLTSISVDSKNTVYDSRNNCNAIIKSDINELIVGCKNTEIPDDVTIISYGAFSGCSGLTSIAIPESVTNICSIAFSGCSGLTSIVIPKSVTSIDASAFSRCSSLASILVDSKNTVYDSRNNCNAIIESASNELIVGCKNTEIPNGVTRIGYSAFSECSGLTSIAIPSSVTGIDGNPFSGCSSLTSISVDSKNTVYDSRNNCNAIIESASNELIVGCKNTEIPNGVTSIGDSAFDGCSGLTSIAIPKSVTSIGNRAFDGCSGLTSIVIADGVTSIDAWAFDECSSLTSIAIPSSVTYIAGNPFYGCSGLTSISVDSKNTVYDSRNNCNAIIESASNELIVGCKNTEIPNGVTSIGDSAFFECSGLTSIVIPESMTSIEWEIFWYCGLTSITIPSSVTSIDDWAFYGCDDLTTIYADADSYAAKWAKEHGYTVKPIPIVQDTPSKEEDESPDKPSVTPAKKGKTLTSKSKKCKVKVTSSNPKKPTVSYVKTTNTKATTLTIPDTVKIDNVTYKVTSIADKAFLGNKKLKTVTLGKNVTSIGKDAFKNCTKLKTINVKSTSFKKIGATAFSGCKNLTKITLKSTKLTKSSVGKNALKGTNKKLVIKVPKNKVKTYNNYFKKKGNTKVRVTK